MPSHTNPSPNPSQAGDEPEGEGLEPEEPPHEQPQLPELDAMTRFLPRALLGLPGREGARGEEAH